MTTLEQITKEAENLFDEEFAVVVVNNAYGGKHAISLDLLEKTKFHNFLTEQITKAVENALEATRLDGFVSPHVPPDGFKSEYPRCGDCFCTEQTDHTHSTAVAEQAKKIERFRE